MLRLQNFINTNDFIRSLFFIRAKTLRNVNCAQNLINRTHITFYGLFPQDFVQSRLLSIKKIHTLKTPRCQAGQINQINNLKTALRNEEIQNDSEDINETDEKVVIRKKHSESQLLHKQMAHLNAILEEFPQPVNSLYNIYSIVKTQLKQGDLITVKYAQMQQSWICNCRVKWPEDHEFVGKDFTKKSATAKVALQCLYWLKDLKKLKNGLPVVFDMQEIKNSQRQPIRIYIDAKSKKKVENLLQDYDVNIKPIIDDFLSEKKVFDDGTDGGSYLGESLFYTLKQRNIIDIPRVSPDDRNTNLYNKLKKRKPVGYTLPIDSYRDELLKKVNDNPALLIKGDTGCGKTTRVPQFIMDSFIERGKASDCNIVVTQPRRLSAISLAERIAHERGEKIGDVVGYKVKLKHALPVTPGAILFCTTGVLLRKMQSNPNLFGCSHVIVDEAHERNVEIDLLLALLKGVLQKNKNIRVIIMSATMNADLFQNYLNCDSLQIPGRTYPVKMHFQEDISKTMHINWLNKSEFYQKIYNPQFDCERMARVVNWINDNKPPGAILCFLPGWNEIVSMEKELKNSSGNRRKLMILPVHSLLSHSDQQKIFAPSPSNVRKIILATDIAETGITVPDVVYVVDSAMHKEVRWDKEREVDTMQSYWISRANLLQRRGRAGRVQPGESYHLISKDEYNALKAYPLPEIKRVSLERVALDCKVYSNQKVADFLSQLLEPPDLKVVNDSIENLTKLGAFDMAENLTVLGRKISNLILPPALGKTVIYSTIFNCVDTILTIATIFYLNFEIFRNSLERKEEIRNMKRRFNETSDHLALNSIYRQWEAYRNESESLAEQFADEIGLYSSRMYNLKKLKDLHARHLRESLGIRRSLDADSNLNKYSQSDEIVKAVILSGVDHIMQHVEFEKIRDRFVRTNKAFRDENLHETRTTPESVNHQQKSYMFPFFTYIKKTFSFERRRTIVRDSSMISPLITMLFSQGHVFGYEQVTRTNFVDEDIPEIRKVEIMIKLADKENVSLICDENLAELLFRLRDSIWTVVRYIVENQSETIALQSKEIDIVSEYKDRMLVVLDEMLRVSVEQAEIRNVEKTKKLHTNPFIVNEII